MGPNVVVRGGMSAMLTDVLAGEFDAATIGLFINDADPGKAAVAADFDPPTFTTSTPIAATWGEIYLNANGDYEVSSQLIQFDWDSGAEEVVYGFVLKSASVGTPLLMYGRLDAPKNMAHTGDSLALVVRLTMSPQGFGASVQVSE